MPAVYVFFVVILVLHVTCLNVQYSIPVLDFTLTIKKTGGLERHLTDFRMR